jgi:hypothetical protein
LLEVVEPVCLSTLKNAISFHYKREWKAMDRPRIRKEHTQARRAFAREWLPKVEKVVAVWCFLDGADVELIFGLEI